MRSTFYGMEVARSGLYTAQNELNVTGHNISNVDTVGYTRQRLDTAALPALAYQVQFAVDTRATAGRGVEALTVDQIRNAFTDAKYRVEASSSGYWETRKNEFALVEQLYNFVLETDGSSASVDTALKSFYSALQEMANEKTNSVDIRKTLQDAGNKLAECINYVYDKLEEQHNNLNGQIAVQVDRINDIAVSIANLNDQIFGYEITGSKANDLRDARNLLLDELAGIVNVEYYESSKGHLIVTIGNRRLVDGVESNLLVVDPDGATNKLDVEGGLAMPGKQYTVGWADLLGQPTGHAQDNLNITSGSLKALFDMRDGDTAEVKGIPYMAKELNDLCRKIVTEVNELHRQGYTMPYSMSAAVGLPNPSLHDMVTDVNGNRVAMTDANGNYIYIANFQTETGPNGVEYYPSTQGVDFFYSGTNSNPQSITAKTFRLSDEIASNIYLIANSTKPITVPDEGYSDSNQNFGDVKNMYRISNLYDRKGEVGEVDSFVSRLKNLITTVAREQNHLNSMDSAQQTRVKAIEQERKSVSGVSLDEEMTNVIKFQHAYNASARIITAIDEELDTLINKMGVVGR